MGLPTKGKFRVLDFDIENRPLSYWRKDRPTADITAIAAAFTDRPKDITVWLLGDVDTEDILREFRKMYDAADMVTGHYILGHDLPIINGHMVEAGFEPLAPKLAEDTLVHLMGWHDIPRSQEHLAEMLGVPAPKVQMSQHKWRASNRLTQKGLDYTYARAYGDVKQHMQMRKVLRDLGLLGRPTVWRP
jgi:hypothetical protein